MEAGREQVESWKKNPWHKLPRWAKWTIGIVGALIIFGLGAAAGNSKGDLEKEVASLEGQLAQSTRSQKSAEEQARQIEGQREQILGAARRKASRIEGSAVGEANQASDKLASLKSEVKATQAELEEVSGSLDGAETEAALSTIGNGIWKAEVDYIPGTYRAPGGSSCYWATLNSADPQDIASNEIGNGPQIATIETPYFQTDGCGTWERIE
jgi:vacuolar-type H+-ATPase subunit H